MFNDNITILFLALFLTPVYWSLKSLLNNDFFWEKSAVFRSFCVVALVILIIISRISLLLYMVSASYPGIQKGISKYLGLFLLDLFYWVIMSVFLERKYIKKSMPIFNEVIINAAEILALPLLGVFTLLVDYILTFQL